MICDKTGLEPKGKSALWVFAVISSSLRPLPAAKMTTLYRLFVFRFNLAVGTLVVVADADNIIQMMR